MLGKFSEQVNYIQVRSGRALLRQPSFVTLKVTIPATKRRESIEMYLVIWKNLEKNHKVWYRKLVTKDHVLYV